MTDSAGAAGMKKTACPHRIEPILRLANCRQVTHVDTAEDHNLFELPVVPSVASLKNLGRRWSHYGLRVFAQLQRAIATA